MMKFLKTLAADAQDAKLSLSQVIQNNLGGFEPARGFKKIHASAVTQDGFCPREVALLDITQKKPKDHYIPTALRTTFDLGNATCDLVRENWLGKAVIGNWVCVRCDQQRSWCRKPQASCKTNGKPCEWKYREVEFFSPAHEVSGSIDLIVDLAGKKFFVVEVKIISPDEFAILKAPLAEHSIRTKLYLKLIADSTSIYKAHVNQQKAKVLYVSRGYGKKNPAENDAILPFKEFEVTRDDVALAPYLELADAVKLWRSKKVVPNQTCQTSLCPRAKRCSVAKECFSGQYQSMSIFHGD